MSKYDLEDRTLTFAIQVRRYVKSLPNSMVNFEDGRQVVKASGSIGANYIEANEKLGPKDFGFRLKIARKEAKETKYWLRVIKGCNHLSSAKMKELDLLIDEAEQLRRIISTIINNTAK